MTRVTIMRMMNDDGDNDDVYDWYVGSSTCPESSNEHVRENFVMTIR